MFKLATITLIGFLVGCSNDPELCNCNSDQSFTKAVSLKLDELGFPYIYKNNSEICFKLSRKPEFKRISREVTKDYNAVATVLTSQEDKHAVFSLAQE